MYLKRTEGEKAVHGSLLGETDAIFCVVGWKMLLIVAKTEYNKKIFKELLI